MMAPSNDTVVIIGAGLSGLTLALALHQQGILCTLYESRPAPLNIGGAVMLSPNALRVLDALGIYETVKPLGYSFQHLNFRNEQGALTETYEFGGAAKYGYDGLRIYRHVLIDALVAAVKKADGVTVCYGRKFTHIVSEDVELPSGNKGVEFAFADGATARASLLVGADGIHSTVRLHLYPDLETRFLHMAGITAAVPTAQLQLPAGYHIPVTLSLPGGSGAFAIAPQMPDGSEVLIGRQRRILEEERGSWETRRKTSGDDDEIKQAAVRFLQQDADKFPAIVQNAVSHIDPQRINVWPFYAVPKLDRWSSTAQRVILVGDAAHAIPPSAGQGINLAFEDVYMLALLLGYSGKDSATRVTRPSALTFWQTYRQDRVDKVFALNHQIDLRRMPSDDAVFASGTDREPFNLAWLYSPDFKQDVDDWVASRPSMR